MKVNLRFCTVVIALLMFLVLTLTFVTLANETVKIGVLFPVTGPLARGGLDCREGVELATKLQNENGGLFGKQIELVYGDAVDPQIALTETERLISKEGVNIIVGTYSSSLSYSATSVSEKYKKIFWETSSNSDEITNRGYQYLFRANAMASYYLDYAGNIIEKTVCGVLNKSSQELKIALVVEDTVYGVTAFESSEKMFEERGFTNIVLKEIFDPNAVDLSSLIMKLKNAEPDLLVMAAHLPQEVLFWNQARDLNWNVSAYLCPTGEGATTAEYFESLGNDVNGHIIVSYCPPPQAVNPQYAVGINEFGKEYEEEFGHKVISVYPLVAFAGTQALFEVMEQAGSDDPEAIRESAQEIEISILPTGYGLKFDSTGQNIWASCVALQWQGGGMWTTWPPEAAVEGHDLILPLPTWQERDQGKDI